MGANGGTPTERLRGRGVQRPAYELGEKVLFLPHALGRREDFGSRFDYGIYSACRSHDGQAHVGTSSGVIRCRTVRQLSAEKRWDGDFAQVHALETSTSLRHEATEACTRQTQHHQASAGECASPGKCSIGSVLPPSGWVAVPSELEKGTLQNTLSVVVQELNANSRKRLEELPWLRATRKKWARHGERAGGTRIEDPDQQRDMEEGGTGASSSRDGVRNEPAGPSASSGSADQLPRKQRRTTGLERSRTGAGRRVGGNRRGVGESPPPSPTKPLTSTGLS